jgi:emp24/gp25L/p24 family/GOLD
MRSYLCLFFLAFLICSIHCLNFEMTGKTEQCFRKKINTSYLLSASFVISGQGEDKVKIDLKDPQEKLAFEGGLSRDSAFVIKPEIEGVYTLCFSNQDRNRKTVSFHLDNGDLITDYSKYANLFVKNLASWLMRLFQNFVHRSHEHRPALLSIVDC